MRACERCGAFLDAPRFNHVTRMVSRKCSQCLTWHPLSPQELLVEELRRRKRDRMRRVA